MPVLLTASLIVLFEALSTSVLWPVLHSFVTKTLHGDVFWEGVLFAVVAGPKIVLTPMWGRFSDRIGRRGALIIAASGKLIALLGWYVAPWFALGLWVLAGSRLLVGVFEVQSTLVMAVAADVSTTARRAASLALLGMAFGVAFALGPAIGGFAAGSAAIGYTNVIWFSVAFTAIALGLVLFVLPETAPKGDRAAESGVWSAQGFWAGLVAPWALVRGPRLRVLLSLSLLTTLAMSILIPVLTPYLEDLHGFDVAHAGMAFVVFGVVGAVFQGAMRPLVARYGEFALLLAGLIACTTGFFVLAFEPTLWWFWAGFVCIGAGSALVIPCMNALLSHSVAVGDQGSVMGVSQSATGIGRVIGLFGGGALFWWLRPGAPFAAAAAICGVCFAIVLWQPAHCRRIEMSGAEVG